jgi:Mn-dependent DtxR family transcriptional regulator
MTKTIDIRNDLPVGEEMEKKVLKEMEKVGKPVRPGEIAKALGADSKEISKIFSALKKEGKVISPKRCYYSLNP